MWKMRLAMHEIFGVNFVHDCENVLNIVATVDRRSLFAGLINIHQLRWPVCATVRE